MVMVGGGGGCVGGREGSLNPGSLFQIPRCGPAVCWKTLYRQVYAFLHPVSITIVDKIKYSLRAIVVSSCVSI